MALQYYFSHRLYRLCVVCRVRRARRSGPLQARRIGIALVHARYDNHGLYSRLERENGRPVDESVLSDNRPTFSRRKINVHLLVCGAAVSCRVVCRRVGLELVRSARSRPDLCSSDSAAVLWLSSSGRDVADGYARRCCVGAMETAAAKRIIECIYRDVERIAGIAYYQRVRAVCYRGLSLAVGFTSAFTDLAMPKV